MATRTLVRITIGRAAGNGRLRTRLTEETAGSGAIRALAFAALAALALFFPAAVHPVTLADAMNAALENDSSLADARSNLVIARNSLAKAAAPYGSSLSLSASAKGSAGTESVPAPGGASPSGITKSVTASLSVPLAKWLTVALSGSTDLETNGASLSLSLSPFAKADSQAETAWQKAVIQSESAVRQSMLSVRREYRAVLTAKAEYAARAAAVTTARNALSKIQYLVELGKERKSDEISAYSDLMDAQGGLDAAENNLATAVQNLNLRTGLDITADAELEALDPSAERTLADEDAWYARSAEIRLARLALRSQTEGTASAVSLPDLSIGTSVDDAKNWSVSAKISVSPDVFFQKTKSSADESLAIQKRSFETTERNVRTAYANQASALAMARRNYENARRIVESARLSETETRLLLERGEAAQAALDSATEKMLSAEYQLAKAAESLENARDQLDMAWQLSAE